MERLRGAGAGFSGGLLWCNMRHSQPFLPDPLMKFVSTIVGLILFILFFGFALKNTQEVDLHFFLNYELRGPLVLMLLAFFVAGAGLGILAVTPTVFRHRRETSKHKNTIEALQNVARSGNAQPQPDSVNTQH
jgi:lipopolysaccharide assembly protein A